jgi:mono/diheme cytochrome c family protein
MPRWEQKLTQPEIEAVADYLLSLGGPQSSEEW